jgi:hypothetical protein
VRQVYSVSQSQVDRARVHGAVEPKGRPRPRMGTHAADADLRQHVGSLLVATVFAL